MMEVGNGVRFVLCVLRVMLCMLFFVLRCMLLCILEAAEAELRLLEALERCAVCRSAVLCEL